MAETALTKLVVVYVGLDDELIDFAVPAGGTVADVLRAALSAYGVHEDADSCHLAEPGIPGRLYLPYEPAAVLEDQAVLGLRLPQ